MADGIDRYPSDPSDAAKQLREELRELRREVEELKRRRPLQAGTIVTDANGVKRMRLSDQGVRLYYANGATSLIIGELGGGDVGLGIWNESGRPIFRVTQHGQEHPRTYLPWAGFPWWAQTTDAGYTGNELFRVDFDSSGNRIAYDLMADPQGGTMDLQVTIKEIGLLTSPVVLSVVNAVGQVAGSFIIPVSALLPGSGTDAHGRRFTMRVEARRTSGANPVRVRLNTPFVNED